MPAAMRAEVRMSAWMRFWHIGGASSHAIAGIASLMSDAYETDFARISSVAAASTARWLPHGVSRLKPLLSRAPGLLDL
jgi:hypothetical protein